MNASIIHWHIESARVSLQAASELGSRDASHALKILQHPWPRGGRPVSTNDQEALEAIARIGGCHAVREVAKARSGPAGREALEHRLRKKLKKANQTE